MRKPPSVPAHWLAQIQVYTHVARRKARAYAQRWGRRPRPTPMEAYINEWREQLERRGDGRPFAIVQDEVSRFVSYGTLPGPAQRDPFLEQPCAHLETGGAELEDVGPDAEGPEPALWRAGDVVYAGTSDLESPAYLAWLQDQESDADDLVTTLEAAGCTDVRVSPDLDAWARGDIDIDQIRCVLCSQAPCACERCASCGFTKQAQYNGCPRGCEIQ